MDFIYCDSSFIDKGVLHDFSLDYEASLDIERNSFSVEIPHHDSYLEIGDYLYVNGEEYGGVIEKHQINTKTGEAHFSGRTWRSILASHIIEPDSGEAYYTVSGTVSTIINALINRLGISSLFHCETCDYLITEYQFGRYVDAYTGIINLLKTVDMKLVFRFNEQEKKCILYAEDVEDFTGKQYISSDAFDFRIERNKGYVNHIIALGQGQLEERQVVHRYLDENNHVSTTQHFFGADEIAEIYNYGNVESLEDLIKATEDKLLDGVVNDNINITINEILADIGDKFAAHDEETGIETVQYIDSKIITATDTDFSINYTAGIIKVIKVEGVNELEDYATNLQLNLVKENLSAFADEILGDIEDLQKQVDGNIATWFYDADPTLQNEPAVSWTTKELKDEHLGDLYYNTSTGYSWRWQYANNEYSWGRISDVDVSEALRLASTAQDTADHKRRVFYTTPVPPYDKGDLWAQGSNGDILRCNKDRAEGESYNVNIDFILASKYTDDTAADAAQSSADAAQTAADNAQDAADAAQSTADTAQSAAEAAQSTADSAMTAAGNALVAANGKNKVYFQASAPTSGMQKNDTWFDSDNDNAIYIYNGTSWVKEELGANAIANLSITNAKIANGTIQSAKIANLDVAKLTGAYIDSSHINTSSITIGQSQVTDLVSDLADKASTDDLANLDTGLGIKWNSSTFAGTTNNGEAYFCKYDSSTGAYTDENGWVMFNGVKRIVAKGMQINPNTVIPYNTRTYKVLRLSSASATTGTQYYVYYDSVWKSVIPATPSADNIADWTWNVDTDIVLCSYIEPASEAALVEYEQYTPVRTAHQITSGNTAYQNAASAQSTANAAKSTADNAAPKSNAIARSQRIYYRKTTSGAPAKNETWLATSGTGYGNWSLKIPQLTSGTTKYPYLYTAVQTQTVSQQTAGTACTCSDVLLDDTTTVIDGGNIITGTVTANQIASNSINTRHLVVGDMTNYASVNELIEDSDILPNVNQDFLPIISNGYVTKLLTNSEYTMVSDLIPNTFHTNDEFYIEFFGHAKTNGATIQFGAWLYDTNPVTTASKTNNQNATFTLTTTDAFYSNTLTFNSTVWDSLKNGWVAFGFRDTSLSKNQIYLSKIVIRKKSDGDLIVNGTIKGDHIDANTISVSKLTGSISNSGWKIDLDNGTLTLGSLAIGNVTNLQTTLNGKATPADITTAVNNIEIGGGNLLRGTETLTIVASSGNWSNGKFYKSLTAGTVENVVLPSTPIPSVTNGIKITISIANSSVGFAQASVPIRKQELTQSVWVKGNVGDKVILQPLYSITSGSAESGSKEFTIADTNWNRYTYTKTPSYDHLSGIAAGYVYVKSATVENILYICADMLEYGNKATDWSSAPEDVADSMPTVNIIPYPYHRMTYGNTAGNPNQYIANGITWTVNDDGSVIANGTASANSWYNFTTNNIPKDPNGTFWLGAGTYTLSGYPSGQSANGYTQVSLYSNTTDGTTRPNIIPTLIGNKGAVYNNSARDTGDGVTFRINSGYYVRIETVVYSGKTVSNHTIKPQLEIGTTRHDFMSPVTMQSASNRATKYLTTISGTSGISVHDGNDTSNFVNMNSNGVNIYQSGNKVAEFGSSITLGKTNDTHTVITSGGYDIVQNSGSNQETIAHFGYASGTAETGTDTRPYTTFGSRADNSSVGNYSFANGKNVIASGYCSTALGVKVQSLNQCSFTNGYIINKGSLIASGLCSVALGFISQSYNNNAIIKSNGAGSIAGGDVYGTINSQDEMSIIANGNGSIAYGFAEDGHTILASGHGSIAIGNGDLLASGKASQAIGRFNTASGQSSHAEGESNKSTARATHTEGEHNEATAVAAHAQGGYTKASGQYSHSGGYYTESKGQYQTVIGKYNIAQGTETSFVGTDYAFIVGNGTYNAPSNGLTVDWSGNLVASGKISGTNLPSSLTASRALISNGSGNIAVSAVTSTELSYLDGVTSAIQTQLNGKQASITGGASTIASSNLTASRALISNASGKVVVSEVTSTELSYLDGVTSNVQTQINNINNKFTGYIAVNDSVSIEGIIAAGYVTASQKALVFFVPYGFTTAGTYSITSLNVVARNIHGTYVYVRSGTEGATYTPLGSSWTPVISSNAAVRSNELSSFTISAVQNSGFQIMLNHVYALTRNNTGTAITNNTPCNVQVQITVKRTA